MLNAPVTLMTISGGAFSAEAAAEAMRTPASG
jgi:hypothetical protein